MDYRRSRSTSPRRHRNGCAGGNRRDYRRYSRSRSNSRERSREQNFRRRISRSRSRERMPSHYNRGGSNEKDLYRDLIYDDYQEDKSYSNSRGHDKRDQRDRDYERDRERNRDYRQNRHSGGGGSGSGGGGGVGGGGNNNNRRFNSTERESDDSDESYNSHYYNKTPSNTLIVLGLHPHITEADIMSSLIQLGMAATSIRLIRKRNTGASRGFAFVEFNTIDEAARWMDLTQGSVTLHDQSRASLQYSHSRDQVIGKLKQNMTDWYCGKCGVYNFKRRDNCFKCYASREEGKKGGEGSDEVSNILTKKIMLRNLDALTNEESVLTAMQQFVPDLAKRINKILISRDVLTQTSRGICYLNFESLVDSMNLHNALNALDPPLKIDDREILVTYCIDHENRHIVPKKSGDVSIAASMGGTIGPLTAAEMVAAANCAALGSVTGGQYTLSDVPRLAEYSAAMYASTPAEHAHYLQYYTEYYISEINKGQFGNLPSDVPTSSETSANSGAAVALSAIQRKQKKMSSIETTATQALAAMKATLAAQSIVAPRGNDGKSYPTPDVSLYQYDETSGYYYDPTTGLYYDAHSQYYYNSETGAYLYWDQRKSTYILATPAAAAATVKDALPHDSSEDIAKTSTSTGTAANEETKKDKKESGSGSGNKHDKVKVAKKIVKDMEKWAKQLNQKKDYTVVATPQPILPSKSDEGPSAARGGGGGGGSSQSSGGTSMGLSSGYADVGFSILEKKERTKLVVDYLPPAVSVSSKLVSAYGSDSDDEQQAPSTSSRGGAAASAASSFAAETNENDYVDFQKLTCLLCKRAFQSLDILQKHLKMSNLHKENLQKYKLTRQSQSDGASEDGSGPSALALALSYRDRAKERRLKYGESDPPPPNRSRERFETEIKNLTSRKQPDAPAMPIGSSNVGNRLLQKMGWSEGQGLGRKNQGRTNIIEADARSSTAGLGTKSGITPGDDYKTYIKKMMKSRYESV